MKISKPRYHGIKINSNSRRNLIERFQQFIPDGWTIIAHHMTIDPFNISDNESLLGKEYTLKVTEFGISQKACAVKVEGYNKETNNKFPHVTLAINEKNGGKAKDSNDIEKWKKLKNPFFIKGEVMNL